MSWWKLWGDKKKKEAGETKPVSAKSPYFDYYQKIESCESYALLQSIITEAAADIKNGKMSISEISVLHSLIKEQMLIIKSGFYADKWEGLTYSEKKELISESRKWIR